MRTLCNDSITLSLMKSWELLERKFAKPLGTPSAQLWFLDSCLPVAPKHYKSKPTQHTSRALCYCFRNILRQYNSRTRAIRIMQKQSNRRFFFFFSSFYPTTSGTIDYASSYKTQKPVPVFFSHETLVPGPIRFHGSCGPLGADFRVAWSLCGTEI